jgi:hypothetical protein
VDFSTVKEVEMVVVEMVVVEMVVVEMEETVAALAKLTYHHSLADNIR